MQKRITIIMSVVALLSAAWLSAAWLGVNGSGETKKTGWTEVVPGIYRSNTSPAGYALMDGSAALLIDAPKAAPGSWPARVQKPDGVLLTHYHRGVCAGLPDFLRAGIKVAAPAGAEEWLTPDGVRKYWQTSLPLRNSRTAYLIVPEGFGGIDYGLIDGKEITWHGWRIKVVATPGHARVHVALAARKGNGPLAVFCGGAMAEPGKLWAPYTTDWDHWTDAGLVPTAKSLRRLAALKPDLLLPSYGPVIAERTADALTRTAAAVEEVGFLKSFERFTKERLGNAPFYRFLAKEQATSNGSKPWTQVSLHLFLTGNTYVLKSKDNACLMMDPWDKRSADQFAKLRTDRQLGPLEVVMFSHAHYDHYDGIYYLPGREKFEVWTLAEVAAPIAEPLRWRAPFLDARPVKIDRRPRAGDTLAWREYRFRFHYLPGQSQFTMGVETEIDGKRCYFTADNFFHQDMFSGSGGWMGLNRSSPLPYAASAQKVLDAAPDWVLAEHGGPFEFNAEDFRRRVEWGKVSASAADALCPSGNHRQDWDPHRIHVEPLVRKARPGEKIRARLIASSQLSRPEIVEITLKARSLAGDLGWKLEIPAQGAVEREIELDLRKDIPPGRHILPLEVSGRRGADAADVFMALDVD